MNSNRARELINDIPGVSLGANRRRVVHVPVIDAKCFNIHHD